MCGTCSAQSRLASPRSESQLTRSHGHPGDPNWSRLGEPKNQLAPSKSETQLTAFFSNPQNPQRFRVWHHSHPLPHFLSGVFIVTFLIITSAPRAREHLHSTNPCTKRKVLSLTKPKGKIYKTKNDNIKKIPPQLYNTRSQSSTASTFRWTQYAILMGMSCVSGIEHFI